MDPKLKEVADLLRTLGNLYASGPVDFIFAHRFQLGPPLSADALAEAEQFYAIRLPDDYAAFLRHLGNGGAGPSYGLEWFGLPNSMPDVGFRLGNGIGYRMLVSQPERLTRSFPLERDYRSPTQKQEAWQPEAWEAACAEYERWYQEVGVQCHDGTLRLAHEGCGIFFHLVVRGADVGSVWVSDLANDGVIRLHRGPHGFLEWYAGWL